MSPVHRSRSTHQALRFTCCALFVTCLSQPAAAHDRTTSYSVWNIRGQRAHVTVRLSQLDLSRFPWMTANDSAAKILPAYLSSQLQLFEGETACALADGPRPLAAAPGRVTYEWDLLCPATNNLRIRSRLLLDVAPSHLHFARVDRDGAPALERVLSEREPEWALSGAKAAQPLQASGTPLFGYLQLGVEHILSGYDHLAFLLALLLIGGSLATVAKVVTGFTVAHSITLGLAVLGYLRPDPAPVEALIGFSIALVAAENLWLAGGQQRLVPTMIAAALTVLTFAAAGGHGRVPALTLAGLALFAACYFGLLGRASSTASFRWGIAFVFGLVHGFGFASVLMEAGLPTTRLVPALFGFNLGVEAGQLAVVLAVWPLLRFIARRSELWHLRVLSYGSAAVLSVGVFWFISRMFA